MYGMGDTTRMQNEVNSLFICLKDVVSGVVRDVDTFITLERFITSDSEDFRGGGGIQQTEENVVDVCLVEKQRKKRK